MRNVLFACVRIINLLFTHCRGEIFRKEFSKLGEARSPLPETVHLMALTATATKSPQRDICTKLGMLNPFIFSQSPNKLNIQYSVVKQDESLEETFAPLLDELRTKRERVEKTIIFCHTYDYTGRIYLILQNGMGREFTQPVGAPNLPRCR